MEHGRGDEAVVAADPRRAPRAAALFFALVFSAGCLRALTDGSGTAVARAEDRSILTKMVSWGAGDGGGGRSNPPTSPARGTEAGGDNLTTSSSLDYPILFQGEPVPIPPELVHISDLIDTLESTHKPLFWHVPRSAGSTVKDVAAFCIGLTQANEVGGSDGHGDDEDLGIIEDVDGAKFINVDSTSPEGLLRAKRFHIAASPVVHLIVTPYLYEAAPLFDARNKARLFVMLRHPIERAVSMFYYLHTSSAHKDVLGGINSVDKYAKSKLVENNWMTRFLSNKMSGEITLEHEAIAREILRRKILIGLLKHKNESMRRFELYFGWVTNGAKNEECRERIVNWDWPGKNKHAEIMKGSDVYDLLWEQNTFDIRLYEYAEELFQEQGRLFEEAEEDEEEWLEEGDEDDQGEELSEEGSS